MNEQQLRTMSKKIHQSDFTIKGLKCVIFYLNWRLLCPDFFNFVIKLYKLGL